MSAEFNALPYRPNVGIVVFNAQGLVLTGERLDNPGAWQYPQGGVDDGEDFETAARRELYEETGIRVRSAEDGADEQLARFIAHTEDYLYYDFPSTLKVKHLTDKYRGQKQKWYLAFWDQPAESANLKTHKQEFSSVRFIPIAEATNRIVPFKRAIYAEVERQFLPQMHAYLSSR